VATHILSDIDQVATHVGVIHDGRMIFCGSMREMKRRLRRDSFRLDLDGSGEQLRRFVDRLSSIDGVHARLDRDERVVVSMSDGVSRAGALSQILNLAETEKLTLQSIQSGRNETEDVYLQLLQEDEAHGFRRFDLNDSPADDASLGDLPA